MAICAAAGLTRTDPYLVWVPVAVAVSVMAAFLHQVFRRGGRPRLTEGVASSVGRAGRHGLRRGAHRRSRTTRTAARGRWCRCSAVAAAALPALFLGRAGCPGLGPARRAGRSAPERPWSRRSLVGGVPLGGAALAGVLVAGISHSMMRVLFALPGARAAQAAVGRRRGRPCSSVGVVVYLLARIYAG